MSIPSLKELTDYFITNRGQTTVTAHFSSKQFLLFVFALIPWLLIPVAGPDGSFVSTWACNLGVPGSYPGRDEYLSSWLCICSAPNCSKAWSV